jgi:hypothetical protein
MVIQGENGDKLFVLVSGTVQFSKDGVLISKVNAPILFGELSLIYNSLRSTDVEVSEIRLAMRMGESERPMCAHVQVASANCVFYSLNRESFQKFMAIINTLDGATGSPDQIAEDETPEESKTEIRDPEEAGIRILRSVRVKHYRESCIQSTLTVRLCVT